MCQRAHWFQSILLSLISNRSYVQASNHVSVHNPPFHVTSSCYLLSSTINTCSYPTHCQNGCNWKRTSTWSTSHIKSTCLCANIRCLSSCSSGWILSDPSQSYVPYLCTRIHPILQLNSIILAIYSSLFKIIFFSILLDSSHPLLSL